MKKLFDDIAIDNTELADLLNYVIFDFDKPRRENHASSRVITEKDDSELAGVEISKDQFSKIDDYLFPDSISGKSKIPLTIDDFSLFLIAMRIALLYCNKRPDWAMLSIIVPC